MSPSVLDFLYVKKIEREIGRKLDPMDVDVIRAEETLHIQKKNGVWLSYIVPTYRLPHDLMVKEADLALAELTPIFEYAFNNASSTSKVSLW